ncbi:MULTISPECIES: hypothetical protein [Rhizobium/Agrobacterium group]|uniref:hypothetical protein n=1 Tax=Rhizobium/Agrobacterium group TaxID=227290 RepID=UPI001303483F|nr:MULTISPECIES: hypothetical protein [Rhizobium/Agrobacterium group]NSZ43155.1 hypothetical protein [Agrobacterium vitis]NTA26812.1 hypothetical protein [Allorhizobium ampelinum]
MTKPPYAQNSTTSKQDGSHQLAPCMRSILDSRRFQNKQQKQKAAGKASGG